MARTVNGWPVIWDNDTTGPHPRLRKWKVPAGNGLRAGERHFYLRDGSVGFVLMHFILWFHDKIERLDVNRVWDEWGWAVRPVRGQTTGYSNHAGGAAADINATLHPQGVSVRKTFSRREIRRIRVALATAKYLGILRWGGDWRNPDGMHIEIADVSLRRVERVAKILMKTKRGKRILAANPYAKKVILS